MTSNNADAHQTLGRRISGLKQVLNEVRERQDDLEGELTAIKEFNERVADRLDDLDEQLDGYGGHFRQIKVNEDHIADLDLRVGGKVGHTRMEQLEEHVRQLRARIDFLADELDVDAEDLQQSSPSEQ